MNAGVSALFQSGNLIDFLPRIKIFCSSGTVRIDGQPGLVVSRGILIEMGSLVMRPGGGVKFRLSRP